VKFHVNNAQENIKEHVVSVILDSTYKMINFVSINVILGILKVFQILLVNNVIKLAPLVSALWYIDLYLNK